MKTAHLGHKLALCGKPHGKLILNSRRTRQADGRIVRQYIAPDFRTFNTDGKLWWEVMQEFCMAGDA